MATKTVVLPFVRSAFNYDRDAASLDSGLACEDKSLTKQSFAEECDINVIARRFGLTGELPQGVRLPRYEDFSEAFDFHSAMNAIAQANESFSALPAEVRARFLNDPGRFVDFCADRGNRDEAIRLGLIDKPLPAPAAPAAAPLAVNPTPGTPPAPAAAGEAVKPS